MKNLLTTFLISIIFFTINSYASTTISVYSGNSNPEYDWAYSFENCPPWDLDRALFSNASAICFSVYHEVYGEGSESLANVRFLSGGYFETEREGNNNKVDRLGSYVDVRARRLWIEAKGNNGSGYAKTWITW